MACYIGTSYHQVLQVPYIVKHAVESFGQKCKNPIVSLYYDDERGQFITMADSQTATIARFGNQQQQKKTYSLAITYQDPTIKIIGNYLLNQSLLYFATNSGTIVMQDLESTDSDQTNLIDPQLKTVDAKHFYKKTLLNSNLQTAFVGKGVLPFIYSHETAVVLWKGKNVPNDELDLQVPIDDVDCAFLNNCNQLCVANANDMIRIFDIRSNRKKPLFDHHLKLNDNTKSRISKLQVNQNSDPYLYIGKQNGSVYELDSRKACQPTKKFKGITTTIKDMKVTNDFIYTISLDCFFRIFDKQQRKVVSQRYLNAHPTCLAVPRTSDHPKQIYQLEQVQSQEEEEVKSKQNPKKVKQIRKRNKVGLRYLEVDENWAQLKQQQMKAEQNNEDIKHQVKQDFSDDNWDEL